MKKLLEISWGILEDKLIEHKFEIENGVSKIFGQKIAIQSKNVVSYIKFFMVYLSFQYNQTYELYHIYNQNKNQVYNEMHIGYWW